MNTMLFVAVSTMLLLVSRPRGVVEGQLTTSDFSKGDVGVVSTGFLQSLKLYKANGNSGNEIIDLKPSGDVIDLAVVGVNLTIVAEGNFESISSATTFPALKWVYSNTGYYDKFRPYTMVGDYVGIDRYSPVEYLSYPGFKNVKVVAYQSSTNTSVQNIEIGKFIATFQIIDSKANNTLAEIITLYLVRTGVSKDQAIITEIQDGLTYNVSQLLNYYASDTQLLPLSLFAKFKGPHEANKVVFKFLNSRDHSKRDGIKNSAVDIYNMLPELTNIGKKAFTVNAYKVDGTLLLTKSFTIYLTK